MLPLRIVSDGKFYLQLTMRVDTDKAATPTEEKRKQPLVRCDSETIAQKVRTEYLTKRLP